MASNDALDSRLIRKIALIGVAALLGVYAIAIIALPTISPEIGMAFAMLDRVKSFPSALNKLFELKETWYRPLTFYITNYFVFSLIDIHNITLIKVLSVCSIALNGFIASELARRIFASSLVERAAVFALVVTHPTYYLIAYDGSGIVDPMFHMFMNLFLICFLTLLESRRNLIGPPLALNVKEGRALAMLCGLLVFCTITSQERGMAIYLMMGFLFALYHWDSLRARRFAFHRHSFAVILFSGALLILYLLTVYRVKGQMSGVDYRTVVEPVYVLPNLVKAIELPFRLFFYEMGKAYDAHKNPVFNLLGLPFVLALVAYIIAVLRGNDAVEKRRLLVLSGLFACALPMPVMFGGNSWHFFTAGLYVSIGMARALCYWLSQLVVTRYIQALFVIAFFIWLAGSTVRGIHSELPPQGNLIRFMTLVPKALADPALIDIDFTPEVVYYDTGSYRDFTWPFGGQGHLFRYLYKNTEIIEIAVSEGKLIEGQQPFCDRVKSGMKALYVGYDTQTQKWRPMKEKPYCAEAKKP